MTAQGRAERLAWPPEVGRVLVDFLRSALDVPDLALAEPATPLEGGFDTAIYAVRLRNAPVAFTGPLILRVLAPHHDPARALRERAIQNAIAAQGYPAARVLVATSEGGPVGAPFLIMQRLPGTVLAEAQRLGMAAVLADAQSRLHALDPEPLLAALDQETGSGGRSAVGFDAYLASLERRIARAALDGLSPAMRWLLDRRPARDVPAVICHGDFHPLNVLVAGGRVTGVVDWPNALVAEPEFDVAATLNILRFVPVDLSSLPWATRVLARVARRVLTARYLAGYRRRRELDAGRLAYYEVAAAMRALVQAGEALSGHGRAPSALDVSAYPTRLAAHAEQVTGVRVVLPAARPR